MLRRRQLIRSMGHREALRARETHATPETRHGTKQTRKLHFLYLPRHVLPRLWPLMGISLIVGARYL